VLGSIVHIWDSCIDKRALKVFLRVVNSRTVCVHKALVLRVASMNIYPQVITTIPPPISRSPEVGGRLQIQSRA
jgi:hypothetical protein